MPAERIRPPARDGAGLDHGRSGDLGAVRPPRRDVRRKKPRMWLGFVWWEAVARDRPLARPGDCGFKESLTGDEPHEEPEADGLPVLVQASADAEHDRTA